MGKDANNLSDSCNIRVYDRDFNWIGMTEAATSAVITRELYGAGKIEIKISPENKSAVLLINRGNIIVINNDMRKSGIVSDFEISENRQECVLTVYGVTGNGMLAYRHTAPPTEAQAPGALGWDRIIAPAETVLKHYADRNLGLGAFDPGRRIPGLFIAPDQARGRETPAQFRFTKLDEDMSIIGKYSEMGYEFLADVTNKRWVFEVIDGANRSWAQSDVSPVTLSTEFKNIESYRYVENYQNYRNTAYCGGAGQDERRFIQIIGAENTGLDRRETFLDCGSTNDLDELLYYGGLKLAEFAPAKTLEVSALPKVFAYGEDYFLGDVVSIIISRIGLRLDARLESVTESWDRQSGHRISARFGEKVPNIVTILKTRSEVI